jgi:hypothetical protein
MTSLSSSTIADYFRARRCTTSRAAEIDKKWIPFFESEKKIQDKSDIQFFLYCIYSNSRPIFRTQASRGARLFRRPHTA